MSRSDNILEVNFDDSKSTISSATSTLSHAQEENLRRARQVALDNRATKALEKCEIRVAELKKRLGITMSSVMSGDQINRVSHFLVEQQAKHEEIRLEIEREQNKILGLIQAELRYLRKKCEGMPEPTANASSTIRSAVTTAPRSTIPVAATNLSQVGSSVSKVVGGDAHRAHR